MSLQPKDINMTMQQQSITTKVSSDDDSVHQIGSSYGFDAKHNEQRNHMVQSPTWHIGQQGNSNDYTISALPDIPSPYSPLPPSLQSEDEWCQSNVEFNNGNQKESESNIQISNRFASTDNHHRQFSTTMPIGKSAFNFVDVPSRDLAETSPGAVLTHSSSHASSRSERSHVIPTIMYMKNSLQDAHQTQYLLRQENESLLIECSKLQEHINQWEEHGSAIQAEAQLTKQMLSNEFSELKKAYQELEEEKQSLEERSEQQLLNLQKSLSNALEENETLANRTHTIESNTESLSLSLNEEEMKRKTLMIELSTLHDNLASKEQQEKLHLAIIEMLEANIRELHDKSINKESNQLQKQKRRSEEYEIQVATLLKEKESVAVEVLRLQAMVVEGKQEIKRRTKEATVLTENQERIEMLERQRREATDLNETLRLDIAALKDKQSLNADNQLQSIAKLENELEVTRNEKTSQDSKMLDLEAKLCRSTAKTQEVSLQLQLMSADNATLQSEANRLQAELVNALERATEMTTKSNSHERQYKTLNSDLQKAVEKLEVSESELTSARSDLVSLRSENGQLSKELQDSKKAIEKLYEMDSTSTSQGNQVRRDQGTEVACQTDSDDHVEDILNDSVFGTINQNPLARRFTRVKDAAERATLIREYKQEISRLRQDYDNEIKFLSATHDHNLKQILHDAKIELMSRVQESKHHHQAEVVRKIAEMRLQHQLEIEKVKDQFNEALANFEDTLQETLSDRTSLVNKVSELTTANEQLQHSTKELSRQLNVEKQRNKLEQTLKIDKKKWQQETNRLLISIQKQCNDAFRSTIRELQNEASPRTVLINEELNFPKDYHPTFSVGMRGFVNFPDPECSGTLQSTDDVHQLQSPMQVNKTLDETEAILQNLLGGDMIL